MQAGITVSPDEEQSLNHYVEDLQNMLLSVPTKEINSVKESESSSTARSPSPKISKLNTATTHGGVSTANDKSTRGHATTALTPGFPQQAGRKRRKTTAFWSVRPNNVSVVLRTDEPFIEKEEPEPEPEPEPKPEPQPQHKPQHKPQPQPSSTPRVIESTTIVESISSVSTLDVDTAAELEDVPQLSGTYLSPESQRLRNEEILKKISNLRSQVRRVPVSESLQPQYRKDIIAAREHLKRSLALAAAAERRLQRMYESEAIPLGQSSDENGDVETVINVLYNARSKLSEYFDMKSIPPEMRRKATVVINTLKKILCVSQVETQNLIKKLLSNNMQILNILEVPSQS
ncbi:sperm equatorial segment protein 1 isoform X2 [Sorex araneus]|uniref:sperm equatorial segment protein 1 isoform X2 n=1 Tax=Sorex araneus TaxID=42254 RepID=UPI002433E02C|nr:sperm equatorial segment protein 1 isoform X2 [Sorex araneus]